MMTMTPEELLNGETLPGTHIADIEIEYDNHALPCGFEFIEQQKYIRRNKPDLIIIAARPGCGKTALACQLAVNVAKHSPVLLFSLEMTKSQLATRLQALELERSINKLHLLKDTERANFKNKLQQLNLRIDDTNALNINALMNRAITMHQQQPLGLIIVDYLQIVNSGVQRTKAEEVFLVAEKLKTLAKDCNCPVIALAQMNRNVEGRSAYQKDPKPMMSDLADSAGIEKWADFIMFIHRPYLIDKNMPKDIVNCFVAKNRNGDTQNFDLSFSGEIVKFFNRAPKEEYL
jgi:replicative DNA helicase